MLPFSQAFPVGSRSCFIQLLKGVRAKGYLPSGAVVFYVGSREIKWFWHLRRFEPSCETRTSLGGEHSGLCMASPGICVKLPQAGQGNDHRSTLGASLSSEGTVMEQVVEHLENCECFPSGKSSDPFHKHLKMNFSRNSR